jgi:DNA-binding XRE family transcriptional regulator
MTIEAVQVKKIELRHARAQLRLTQVQLAKRAHVGRQVVYNAENDITISQISAWAVLDALNQVRAEKNLPPLEFEHIDWKVQGDGGGEEKEK